MTINLWDRVRMAWAVIKSPLVEVDIHGLEGPENPYLEGDEAEAIYETLENALHALYPLLKASENAGVLAARGLVWGSLYMYTADETATDQRGLAWELARLCQDYLPEDQDPVTMPGIQTDPDKDLFEQLAISQTEEGTHNIRGEMMAFFDGALTGDYEGAANVMSAIRTRLGTQVYQRGAQASLEDGQKVVAVSFLGSCLASLADRYADLEMGEE